MSYVRIPGSVASSCTFAFQIEWGVRAWRVIEIPAWVGLGLGRRAVTENKILARTFLARLIKSHLHHCSGEIFALAMIFLRPEHRFNLRFAANGDLLPSPALNAGICVSSFVCRCAYLVVKAINIVIHGLLISPGCSQNEKKKKRK